MREYTLGTFLAAVNGESDALIEERDVGLLLKAAQLAGGETEEAREERPIMRAWTAIGPKHLIVGHAQLVFRERFGNSALTN